MTKTLLAAAAVFALISSSSAFAAPSDAPVTGTAKAAHVKRAGAKLNRANRQDSTTSTDAGATGTGLNAGNLAVMGVAVAAVVGGAVAAADSHGGSSNGGSGGDNPNSP